MTDPLVSVVVPSRNRPALASAAIASILAQTYQRFELVVVDDASTAPLVLPEPARADPRVRLVRSEERLGPGAARNLGVGLTTGPFIAFLDDDDVWSRTKLERQLAAFARCGSETAAVEGGYEVWDDGRPLVRYRPQSGPEVARTLLRVPKLQPSTVIVRREAFEALGGFDASMLRAEDWELWLRLAESYAFTAVPDVLVRRRLNSAFPRGEAVAGFRELRRRLEPRLERLPADETRSIRTTHDAQEGFLLWLAGRRAEGLGKLLAAWRADLRSVGPPQLLLRALLGERVWATLRRTAVRARGRPVLRSW